MNDKRLYGIYRAIVTDTTGYKTTGRILTRISVLNNFFITSNLLNNYESGEFQNSVLSDKPTLVATQFGGGYDSGAFMIPKVNSMGLVMFVDGRPSTPVWICTLPNLKLSEDTAMQVDAPSDDLENDLPAITCDESGNATFNSEDEGSFIFKTKSNTFTDPENQESMNWEINPVENGIVLNKSKAEIRHNNTNEGEDGHESIRLSNSSITFEKTTSESDKREVVIDDSGINIVNLKDNCVSRISIGENGTITLSSTEGNDGSAVEASVSMNPSNIEMNVGHNTISFSKNLDGGKDTLTLSTKNLVISADNISLGETGYSVVTTSNSNFGMTMEDGTMLVAAKNIKV